MEKPYEDYKFPPHIESISLEVKAKTNHTGREECEVVLKPGLTGDVVLDIKGTPGKWYLSTIDEYNDGPIIYIDRGAEWICTNFGEVRENARRIFAQFKEKKIREIIV